MVGSIRAVALAVTDISGSESEQLPAPCFANSSFEPTMEPEITPSPLG
jgi:hypothetical protein